LPFLIFLIVLVMVDPKPSKEPEVGVNSNKQLKVDVKQSKVENKRDEQSSKKPMVVELRRVYGKQLNLLLLLHQNVIGLLKFISHLILCTNILHTL
jgi:hypothetical protein